MNIREIMNINVSRILVGSTLRQAAEVSALSNAADLAVVDETNTFLGVLSEGDLSRAALPSLGDAVAGGENLSSGYGLLDEKGRELAGEPIDRHVIRDPVTVSPADPVRRAAALMTAKQIRRLPVVESGKLVGTVSRADICGRAGPRDGCPSKQGGRSGQRASASARPCGHHGRLNLRTEARPASRAR